MSVRISSPPRNAMIIGRRTSVRRFAYRGVYRKLAFARTPLNAKPMWRSHKPNKALLAVAPR